MKTKTPISKGLSIYLLILVIHLFAFNTMAMYLNYSTGTVIGATLGMLSFAAAAYYEIDGYSKNAALSYKMYMITVFLSMQMLAVNAGIQYDGMISGVTVFAGCLAASCALALAISHDLGKRTSMILCGLILVLTLVLAVLIIVNCPGRFRGGDVFYTVATIRLLSNCLAAQIAVIMTMAKYGEKAIRKNA